MILIITTTTGCPNNCSYCPQELYLSRYKGVKTLTLDNFKKILKNVPKDVKIDFSGYSEPFQNPKCSEMITYAYTQGYKVQVFTTLNGFTEEDAIKLKDVKFERFTHHNVIPDQYIPDFIDDTILPEVLDKTTRAGALGDRQMVVSKGCKMDDNDNMSKDKFSYNSMTPNGDVYLCCMDWGLEHKLGNLFKTNLKDLQRDDMYDLCHHCEYSKC